MANLFLRQGLRSTASFVIAICATQKYMAETLEAESRDSHGKRSTKRLRSGGKVPAVLYGHGQETVSLAVPAEQIRAAIRHGSRVVKLKGAANDSALIRDLQYDTYGLEILHIDFTRVSEHERMAWKCLWKFAVRRPGSKKAASSST